MQVLNVIELKNGLLENVSSFVMQDDKPEYKKLIVDDAELDFLSRISNNISPKILSQDDINIYLEEGYYEDKNGYEVILTWSHRVNQIKL